MKNSRSKFQFRAEFSKTFQTFKFCYHEKSIILTESNEILDYRLWYLNK